MIERGKTFNCTHGNWEEERFILESERDLLQAKLAVADKILSQAKRFQYDDGLIMYDLDFSGKEIASLMDVYRKLSEGKP